MNHRQRIMPRISVAPMMDWTTRHCRYFMRQLSSSVVLYTEMITTGALLHGDSARFLQYNTKEHPIVCQLGGSDPEALALCAEMVAEHGYDEVNLNVGCPSDRVQSGRFGACLMAEPELVAACIDAMKARVDIPVTVKTRIGIDERDSYEELVDFIGKVASGGCDTFIIHARKAWLEGLSPKQNRTTPPLRYDVVYQLKQDFPDCQIILNGGIENVHEIETHLQHVDGVMLGRAAYHNPYLLAEIEEHFYSGQKPTREEVLLSMQKYVEQELANGVPVKAITRHMLGLYRGQSGARSWRRRLTESAQQEILDEGLSFVA